MNKYNLNKYKWSGIDSGGNKKTGQSYAKSKDYLYKELIKDGIAITYSRKLIKAKFNISKEIFKHRRPNTKELCLFFHNLYMFTNSGIPIIDSLNISLQNSNNNFKKIILSIINNINKGESLHKALEKTNNFSKFITETVGAGEKSGNLSSGLKNLYRHLQRKLEFSEKIKSAIISPAITITISIAIFITLTIFVVPQFEEILIQTKRNIPKSTLLMFKMSRLLKSEKNRFIVSIVLIIILLLSKISKKYLNNKYLHIKKYKDILLTKIPLINDIIIQSNLLQFINTLSLLIDSGITLKESLSISQNTIKNYRLKEQIKKINILVEHGHPLSIAIEKTCSNFFYRPIILLISLGEKTGKLKETLKKSSYIIENKLESKIILAISILQPLLLLITGFLIVFFLISIYLPIFDTPLDIQLF